MNSSPQQLENQLDDALNNWVELMQQGQQMLEIWSSKDPSEQWRRAGDHAHINTAFTEWYQKALENPETLLKTQLDWWEDYTKLCQYASEKWNGEAAAPVIEADKRDRRFRDDAWQEHPAYDWMKQYYLMTAKRMRESIEQVDGVDAHVLRKVSFYTQQMLDALSPNNFAATNPEVMRETLATQGENLVRGMEQLLADMKDGRIAMTDVKAFQVGENIACTKGHVVAENDLMQLIHYAPTQANLLKTPLLIIPAWINKYYILDLQAENSFVKWAVDQGCDTYIISWVNPDASHKGKDFEDYMSDGILHALDVIEKRSGQPKAHAVGYCLGGTLLSATQAYLESHKKQRLESMTLLTTLTDFSEAGDLSIFIDDAQLQTMEKRMSEDGYLDGDFLGMTFNMLRANDLIWHFVVQHYLLGKQPFPFDLLYWNTDVTRLPATMQQFYLRNMYQHNKLAEAGGISLKNTPIDLAKISCPTYMLSTKEDHIAPWESTYKLTQRISGPTRFVLAESGHVAGVISPPTRKKYNHWLANSCPASPQEWLNGAEQHAGSWWPNWIEWIRSHNSDTVPADQRASDKDALSPAPGSYVQARV